MKECLVALVVVLSAGNAFAANYYIRAGATGTNDGSSWANAWSSFAAVTYTRGDTYFVAGGTYNGDVTISAGLSGGTWITVKKANSADNGNDPGWAAAYATTRAVINGKLTLSNGLIEVDGVTGTGTSGHGIKIGVTTSMNVVTLQNGTGPYHLYHLEVEGPGYAYGSLGVDGIYHANSTKGLHISMCWVHEVPRNGVTIGNNVGTSYSDYGMLFDNNVISEVGGVYLAYPAIHSQALQISYDKPDAYLIIRNNTFKNICGAAISYLGGPGANHRQSRIYNNVFYQTDLNVYIGMSPGVIWTNSAGGGVADYFYFYNNTFYNLGNNTANTTYGRIYLTSAATITVAEARNNLWKNSNLPYGGFLTGITSSSNNGFYNNYGSSNPGNTESADPFVDSAAYDFRLRATANARNTGVDLSSVFSTDIVGNLRSGAWSIGAYQGYIPAAPATVKIIR